MGKEAAGEGAPDEGTDGAEDEDDEIDLLDVFLHPETEFSGLVAHRENT